MPSDHTVLSVGRSNEWQGKHGSFIDYWMSVTNGDGEESWCFNTRKPDTPAPQPGDVIYGHIEPKTTKSGKTLFKLVTEQRPEPGSREVPTPSSPTTPDGAPRSPANTGANSWDSRDARIVRQHSQEMAIRVLSYANVNEAGPELIRSLLKEWTDWFDEDVRAAAGSSSKQEPTNEQGEATGPPSPPAEASPPQKALVTRELNARVATDHHDELRQAAKAHTKAGASELIDGLRRFDVVELLKRYGITPISDVPADTAGLEPVGPGLTDDSDVPF